MAPTLILVLLANPAPLAEPWPPGAPIEASQEGETAPAAPPPNENSGRTDSAEPPTIVVRGGASAADPAEAVNAQTYAVAQDVDRAVVDPVASAYEDVVPKPARAGLRNVLRNLEEPVIFLNNVLQLRFGRALKSAGRFAINSTVGVAGLVDVAKTETFDLPYRPNGFANTLACYGVGPGPYLYLPLVGPTTLRDVVGLTLDKAALPAVVGPPLSNPEFALPSSTIDALNDRIEIDEQLDQMREEEADPYIATRELYLRQREAEIAQTCGKGEVVIDPDLPPRPGKGED